jgi:hypothetical protein
LVIHWANDLKNKILMFGVRKGLEDLEKEDKPSPYIILPGN